MEPNNTAPEGNTPLGQPNSDTTPEGNAPLGQPNSDTTPEEASPSSLSNDMTPSQPVKNRADTGDIILGPPKSQKPLIWCLGILALISLIAAAVFAYLYFATSTSNPAPTPNNNQSSTASEEPTTTEETEITDTLLKKDLDKKIAILFNVDNTDPTFATGRGIGYYDEELFHNGDLSERAKVNSLIRHTLTMKPLNEQEVLAALAQTGYSGDNEKYFRQELAEGVSKDVVIQKYKEVFNKEIIPNDYGSACGGYRYNSQYGFYYDDVLGCGGMTPYERFYYKNRYTTDDNHAYVYTSTAFLAPTFGTNPEGQNTEGAPYYVYCDIAFLEEPAVSEDAKVCATYNSDDEARSFTLNESNYKDYSNYRFVFDKGEDDKYYFNKVEKL